MNFTHKFERCKGLEVFQQAKWDSFHGCFRIQMTTGHWREILRSRLWED